MSFEIGDQPGGYLLLSRCGRGAYGEVFQARNVVTGRLFALKVFPGNGTQSERELTGIKRYQTVAAHSQLLQIYHVDSEDGRLYYVMDLADDLGGEGGAYLPDTLQNRIDRDGRIPAAELRQIANEVAEDLTLLHSKGLFHRDIKPCNIIFLNGRATLGDIGLVTTSGVSTLVGTAGFLSPEVLAGTRPFAEADDFYALGRTIYCALTGNPPEKYPEFPAELDLKSAKDIVSLYNFWCAGNCDLPILPAKPGRARRRIAELVLIVALLVGAPLAGWLYSVLTTDAYRQVENIKDPKTGQSAEKTLPASPLYPKECYEEIMRLTEKYALPEDFVKILPQLKKDHTQLLIDRSAAAENANKAPITEAEIKAMRNKGHSENPEWYIRSERTEAAYAAFNEAHRDDPRLKYSEYWHLDSSIVFAIENLRHLKDIPSLQNTDYSDQLRNVEDLFRQRQEVIESILKEYSTAGKAKK